MYLKDDYPETGDNNRKFELRFKDLSRGFIPLQATSLASKKIWCDLLRKNVPLWGAKPSITSRLERTECFGKNNLFHKLN